MDVPQGYWKHVPIYTQLVIMGAPSDPILMFLLQSTIWQLRGHIVTEGTLRLIYLVFIRKGNITNCFSSATMNERTTWTCSREFEALHTIECSYIGNFLQAWRCPLHYEVSPPLPQSTPLQHENLLYLSFPFTYNDYFTESNLVDTPICNKAKSICFYEHA